MSGSNSLWHIDGHHSLLVVVLNSEIIMRELEPNVPVKSKLQNLPPPPSLPGHFNFWKIFVQIPLLPGLKSCSNAPTRTCFGGRAGAYFTDSGWRSRLENYCLYCKNNFNTFTYFNIDINRS